MKRKLKIVSLGFCLAMSLQSCEKWFDVTANNQIKAEDQFSSADGYRDALTGIYLLLGDQSLYAKDMTYNMMDILSQQYSGFTSSGAMYENIQKFNYTSVRSEAQIKSVWDKYYLAIANVNSALNQLDISNIKWYTGEKEILKGELLALRAYLHFDLLRVFGHSGYATRAELVQRMAIPYVLKYSKETTAQLNYSETFKLMESDIDASLTLLQYDPIKKGTALSNAALSEINRDGFYNKRTNRLNYYAVKALQARVYSWQGGTKLQLAAQAAEEIINDAPVSLLKDGENVLGNKTISTEHLWGLKVDKLIDLTNPLLDATSNTNYNALRIPNTLAESVYETSTSGIGDVDIRYTQLLSTGQLGKVSIKLRQTNINDVDYNTVPLLKLSEMYYIAAEYYSITDMPRAVGLLNKVRTSRKITITLSTAISKTDFDQELIKEYRKEFLSEGQLFFFYKRKGLTTIPNYSTAVVADDKMYMLPIPPSEIEFGNRVQQW